MSTETKPEIHYPIPEFDDLTVAFGAPADAYLTREQLGDLYGKFFSNDPFSTCAEMLFHKGGKLEDYGLRWKADVDAGKGMRALRALLGSYNPKHEIKIATVAFMLREHCDVIGKYDRFKRGKK